MRLSIVLAAVTALVAFSGAAPAWAEYYRVSLTRRGQNLYQEYSTRQHLITRYCYEYVYGDNAVLAYEQGSLWNMVIFSSGTTCPVEGIYRANANLTRVADDLYQDSSAGRYVKTFTCYEYAYGQDAIVLQDRVIFTTGEECDRGV